MATHTPLAPLDAAAQRHHKLRNVIQSALLLLGMFALLSLCTAMVLGVEGMLWAAIGWVIALVLSPKLSPRIVLRMYRARAIQDYEFPEGFDILRALVRRAGLSRAPELWYVPSATLNAFTLGGGGDVAIAVTDGLLRHLTRREFAGVMAHELSHVRNNDLWVMNLADSISRFTRLMSFAGVALMVLSLPLLLVEYGTFPWLLILVLLVAPTIGSLLQMALSRAREFDADLDGAGITGDPLGLASALDKLERYQGGLWERLFLPDRRLPEPSLLRTHPKTDERVRRLVALADTASVAPFRTTDPFSLPGNFPRVTRIPRRRMSGLWY